MAAVNLDLEPLAAETARRSTLEHQTRAATIRRLVVAVEEQRRRLDTQMGEALEVLARAASGTRVRHYSLATRARAPAGS